VEKREPSYSVGVNANWRTVWSCHMTPGHVPGESSNLKRYMHPEVPKARKQPKCPSTDEDVVFTYTYIYLQSHIHTHTHIYILFQILSHYRILQDTVYSSLSNIVGPCWLSIICIV